MKTVYVLLVVVLHFQISFAQQCLTDQWPPQSDSAIRTYVVDLDTPPALRWKEIATEYRSQIKDVLDYTKQYIVNVWPLFTFLLDVMHTKLPLVAETLPEPYGDELKGISKASGIPLGEIVFYNMFYKISSLCTSIVAEDQHGDILHARNLDFGYLLGWDKANQTWALPAKLRSVVISVNYTRSSQVLFRSTTFAGFIGVVTGIKPGISSITLNARFDFNGGYIGMIEWLYNLDRNQTFDTFAVRDTLTRAKSYDEVVEYLSEVSLVAPCYYIVAGTRPGQGAIISRSRKTSLDIQRLGDGSRWFLVQTNHDHWRMPPALDTRLIPATKCMRLKGNNLVTFQSLFNVLASRPMLNKLTVYTTLLKPSTGQLESYIQSCRDDGTPCPLY